MLEQTATGSFAPESTDLAFAENESGDASVSDDGLERTVSLPAVPEDDRPGSNSGAEPVGSSSSAPAEQSTVETVQNPTLSGLESREPGAGTVATNVASGFLSEDVASVDDGPIASELTSIADSDTSEDEVDENAALGTKTGITAHADVAEGATVTYSLIGDAGGLFSIDPETGIVSVAGDLDAETAGSHEIVVLATASDGATQTESFTISIRDIDEYDVSSLKVIGETGDGISEDIAGGSAVGVAVSAEDRDVSDSVTYSVDDARFQIDENGIVTVADGAEFDAESEGTVSFTVTATSTDGSQSSQTFGLSVADVNEHDVSEVTDADTSANIIAENAAAGTQVGIIALAADADVTDLVSYSVSDSRFAVDGDGVVTVSSGAAFDYESEPTITLTVTATSSDGSTSQEAFAVSVSDVAEAYQMADGQGSFTDDGVAEHTIRGTSGAEIITAHDDGGTIYSGSGDDTIHGGDGNDTIIYGEGADTVYGGAGNDFIDDARGAQISNHANYLDGGAGNDTIYGGGGDDTIAGGDGNDALYGEGDNDLIDGGAGDDRIYGDRGDDTLIGGAGNDRLDGGSGQDHAVYTGNWSDYTITESSGVFTIIDNRDGSPDGTDTVTNVESFVFADGTVLAGDLIAEDVSAVSDTDTTANTIAENAAAGTAVGITAFAEDGNASDTVTYSVSDSRFTVDADGVVTVASGAAFDYENEPTISLTVTAISSDGSTSSETFSLDVSDVAENIVLTSGDDYFEDTGVTELSIDAGAGNDEVYGGSGNNTIYGGDGEDFLMSGDGDDVLSGGADDDVLVGGAGNDVLDGGQGDDFLIGLEGDDTIDGGDGSDYVYYDANRSDYTITENGGVYTVVDNRPGSPEGIDTVTNVERFAFADGIVLAGDLIAEDVSAVSDTDSADNTIAENAAPGTTVGITALAEDGNVSDTVTYSVSDSRFTVDANGVVSVSSSGASFDAETEGSIDITVTATSTDGSASSETFTIAVSDVDEYDVSAVSDTDSSANTIAENAAAGTQVGITAQATDADVTDSVTYSVSDSRFTVNANGVVTVASGASFDAATEGSIDIAVTATSSDGSTSSQTFTVGVSQEQAEVSSVTDSNIAANSVAENAAAGMQVGITATADDPNVADTVSYTVSDNRFTVDADGVVTVASGATFDYETEPTIDLTVTATSSDGSTAQEAFAISVSDVAEAYQMSDGQRAFTDTGVAESSITGTSGAETITAHDAGSTIYSGAGDDTIHGGAGNDLIFFGEGADTVYGGAGDDIIDDQAGTQISTQANYIDGGAGNDRIYAGGGDDYIVGGDGYDTLNGEDGNDTIDGGATADWIYGGQGDDTLIGGTGNDTLYGEDGSDLFMYGLGDGSDMIHGGEGTAWTDAIDLGGSSGTASAGDYGSDWTVTITDGSIMNTDTATNVMELSQDADGYIDFSDGSRMTFSDVEEIRW
ncbi:beta strand repeat-containing protein [Roseibium salinum]|uniref:beta strand repeat-containing protein n=1 Tax=Roseibium salinum TaxID=1604349 RepID=UPI00360D4923